MANLGKGLKKARNATLDIAKAAINPLDSGNRKDARDAFSTDNMVLVNAFTPDIPEYEQDTIIPIPDENRAQLNARKRRSQQAKSGRDDTILTEGLGG